MNYQEELGSLVANDLPGSHFNNVACVFVLEISKQSGQSVSSPGDPGHS